MNAREVNAVRITMDNRLANLHTYVVCMVRVNVSCAVIYLSIYVLISSKSLTKTNPSVKVEKAKLMTR